MSPSKKDKAAAKLIERRDELVEALNRHSRRYHLEDQPEISDAEYDRLYRELLDFEAAHSALRRPDSPTRRIGESPTGTFTSVEHRVPMLSLDNAMGAEAMLAFDERVRRFLDSIGDVEYLGEPKLDGAGVELIYEAGRFTIGATRGDGRTGEDVTANLRFCETIPPALRPGSDFSERVSVRGEVTLPIAGFERLNAARESRQLEPFVNPRNAAAGSLRQLHDIDEERLRALHFCPYAIAEGLPQGVSTQLGVLETLQSWGFTVSPEAELCENAAAVIHYHERLLENRDLQPIEIDGTAGGGVSGSGG